MNQLDLRVEVEDNGTGISPEEMALLFREFQQLPNSRRAEQGTGLGLALTRLIVEAQGRLGRSAQLTWKGQHFFRSSTDRERKPPAP